MRGFNIVRHVVLAMVWVILLSSPAAYVVSGDQGGKNIYVTTSGVDDPGCGNTVANACRTIPYAIKFIAEWGDTVWVAPGTYTETFDLESGISVQGAGPGLTILDGEDERGPMVTAYGTDITATVVFSGFIVMRGRAGLGAGMYLDYGSPTIRNCVFAQNSAVDSGPNTGYGGGIYNADGSPTIDSNRFDSNSAVREGGGLYNENGSPAIHNNIFMQNSAWRGGGIYSLSGSTAIRNNVFWRNTATDTGAGLYDCNSSGYSLVRNNIIARNSGGGLCAEHVNAWMPPDYNDVWDNSGGDYQGVATAGGHDLSVDPALVSPTGDDFHLRPGSPCIDAGDPTSYWPITDFDGDPRPMGAGYDIGADEWQALPADVNEDGDVDIVDVQRIASHWGMRAGQVGWDPTYDVDNDGMVTIADIEIAVNGWR